MKGGFQDTNYTINEIVEGKMSRVHPDLTNENLN